MIVRKKIIGVMGSHEKGWEAYAHPIGELIAQRGYHLLTGAGEGVMTEVAKAYTQTPNRQGVVIGIRPAVDYKGEQLSKKEFPNPYIDVPVITPLSAKAQSDAMPYSRNLVNVMTADALVVLPGAHGTQNEVSLGIMYEKPIVLFGPDGAFDKFPESTVYTDDVDQVDHFFTDLFGVS